MHEGHSGQDAYQTEQAQHDAPKFLVPILARMQISSTTRMATRQEDIETCMVKESSEVDDIEDELLNEKWMEFGNRDNVADVENDEDDWLYEENNHVDRWETVHFLT